MQFHKKTFKICLLFLCLLAFRPVGLPQIEEAPFVMGKLNIYSKKRKRSFVVLYDDEDYELISKYTWCISVCHDLFYVVTDGSIRMHRLIMGCHKGKVVDHIKHHKLNLNGKTVIDNRKSNLRICSQGNNTKNQRLRNANTSGYKGVWYVTNKAKRIKRWVAEIHLDYKKIILGYFLTAIEAAEAYNIGALKHHGEFALLNKIPTR